MEKLNFAVAVKRSNGTVIPYDVTVNNGRYTTNDPDVVRAVMAHTNYAKKYLTLETDEEVVEAFLADKHPGFITSKDLEGLKKETLKQLAAVYRISGEGEEVLKNQLRQKPLKEAAQIIIGDAKGVKTPAHIKREKEKKAAQSKDKPHIDTVAQKTGQTFKVKGKDGKQKTVKAETFKEGDALKKDRDTGKVIDIKPAAGNS